MQNMSRWTPLEKAHSSFHEAAAGHGFAAVDLQFHNPVSLYLPAGRKTFRQYHFPALCGGDDFQHAEYALFPGIARRLRVA